MNIETLKAFQKLCIKIEDCLPHLYMTIGQHNAEELAQAAEGLIHALDNEKIDRDQVQHQGDPMD